MAQNQPFIRVFYIKHAPEYNINGGLFHLHTADGQSDIAAVSLNNGTSQILYHAWPGFLTKYTPIFPLGNIHCWNHKEGLIAWLDSIIKHSFLLYSDQGIFLIPIHLYLFFKKVPILLVTNIN